MSAIARYLQGQVFSYAPGEVTTRADCYDAVGVRDFSVDIPIQSVNLSIDGSTLNVQVSFDEIRAENFEVFGEDPDWDDDCFPFQFDVRQVTVHDAVLQAAFTMSVVDGELQLGVSGTPTLSADINSDIEDFPDDLLLFFTEEALLEALASTIASVVPQATVNFLGSKVFGGEFGRYALDLQPAAASISQFAVGLDATGSMGWQGEGCSEATAVPATSGREPSFTFGDGDESGLGLGVTEAMANEVLAVLWADGLFCFDQNDVATLMSVLVPSFSLDDGQLAATLRAESPPTLTIDAGQLTASLPDVTLRLEAHNEVLLDLRASASASGALKLDEALSAFVLSVDTLDLDFQTFTVRHLLSDQPGAEEEFREFLIELAQTMVVGRSFQVLDGVFSFGGLYVRADDLSLETGGVRARLSLYDDGDSAVDATPPETNAKLITERSTAALPVRKLEFGGHDDRAGELVWAWRMDGGSWSPWIAEPQVMLPAVADGAHTVEVQSRDRWLNVDPSPLSIDFSQEPERGPIMGCATLPVETGSAGTLSGLAAGLAVLGLTLRRRHRAG